MIICNFIGMMANLCMLLVMISMWCSFLVLIFEKKLLNSTGEIILLAKSIALRETYGIWVLDSCVFHIDPFLLLHWFHWTGPSSLFWGKTCNSSLYSTPCLFDGKTITVWNISIKYLIVSLKPNNLPIWMLLEAQTLELDRFITSLKVEKD